MSIPAIKPIVKLPSISLAVWGASVFGVLQIHHLPLCTGHSICSPAWGCGPPLNALISYHGFWVALFTLPIWLCCRLLSLKRLTYLGGVLAGLGTAAIAGIIAWQAFDWLPHASQFQRPYFIQRCLFQLAITIDLPAVQLLLSGVTCLACARYRRGCLPGNREKNLSPRERDSVTGAACDAG